MVPAARIVELVERPAGEREVFDAAQELSLALHRPVDLIDLAAASTVLRAQVVGTGRRIHTGDATAADTFEMYTLSDYAHLEYERREVVAAFRDRHGG